MTVEEMVVDSPVPLRGRPVKEGEEACVEGVIAPDNSNPLAPWVPPLLTMTVENSVENTVSVEKMLSVTEAGIAAGLVEVPPIAPLAINPLSPAVEKPSV